MNDRPTDRPDPDELHGLPAAAPVDPPDDLTRARLRARLSAGLDGRTGAHGGRRWWVPAAAAGAAAVLIVGGVVLGRGSDDSSVPVATSPTSSPTPTSASPTATHDPDAVADCGTDTAAELGGRHPAPMPARTFTTEAGLSTFYVRGDRWTLCTHNDDTATVEHAQRQIGHGAPDTAELRVSTDVLQAGRDHDTVIYVAGGLLPPQDGDTRIVYAFPDGHEEQAQLGTDDAGRRWWTMSYLVTTGPLADPGVNETTLPRIRVTVTPGGPVDDAPTTHELEWGVDTCNQADHGC